MIAIQSIETWWTKASRGAPASSVRAAGPEALALTQLSSPAQVHWHRVLREERSGFAATSSEVSLSLQDAQRQLRGLVLHAGIDSIDVMFTSCPYSVGAPQRRNGHAIRLEAGRWCRIIHNGRFGEDHEWWYQETTTNIAFLPATKAIFFEAAPVKIDDHREKLW